LGSVGAPLPFDRVLSRVFMALALLFLFLGRRRLCLRESLRQCLIWSPRAFFLSRTGFMLGVTSFFLLMLGANFCGALQFHPLELSPPEVFGKFASALATGLVVGCVEEIFFRGFVLQGLMQEMKTPWALLASSGFYALLHYFKTTDHVCLDHWQWQAGFSTALKFLEPFRHTTTMIPGMIGLTLVGMVLGIAYLRTGSLYLSIGLHAGWVFLIKFQGVFSVHDRAASRLWFGDNRLVTGAASWVMLVLVGWIVERWGKRLKDPS